MTRRVISVAESSFRRDLGCEAVERSSGFMVSHASEARHGKPNFAVGPTWATRPPALHDYQLTGALDVIGFIGFMGVIESQNITVVKLNP